MHQALKRPIAHPKYDDLKHLRFPDFEVIFSKTTEINALEPISIVFNESLVY